MGTRNDPRILESLESPGLDDRFEAKMSSQPLLTTGPDTECEPPQDVVCEAIELLGTINTTIVPPSPRHYHEACHPHGASSIQHLFDNNKRWREKKQRSDADFFERTARKHEPRYLWIGCSDSRVPAEKITGLAPGEMFVHRNVANLVVSNDVSSLAVVQFAVEQLRVRDIIVCGHYGCGGVRAAMANEQLGLLDHWLRNIRDVCRLNQSELLEIPNETQRFRRIVELNITEQCLNIFKINMVQRNQQKYGFPRIHGLVYDIESGVLKPLEVDFRSYVQKYSRIYRLHSFSKSGFQGDDYPPTVPQMRRNMIRSLADGHEEDEGEMISARYITRAMRQEADLFTPDEVDASVAFARSEGDDPDAPFVQIARLIEYFAYNDAPEPQGRSDSFCSASAAVTPM
ncbi:hypothetical protein PybrP1_001322 [[Pythium] brassicae (nom. inval.)]|nr:hypothetical protein PybrP1_001322 [[Pythium] brassicae (nom. inval.)]